MSLHLRDSSLFTSQAYIHGEWCSADAGRTFAVVNPANGQVLAEMAYCGTAETRRAIESAHRAQIDWKSKPAKERAGFMRKWCDLILDNQEDLAKILTQEQGKPLAEARAELEYCAGYIEWFAEEAKRVYGDTMPASESDKRVWVIKQAIGVVAVITPWNFPCAVLTRKVAPALAAGCTVVCKPSNATPLSAFALAVLAEKAGIPAGVINIVVGNTREIGAELTSNTLVRKVTFTGSSPVGKQLMRECAAAVKRTSMELGGNAPFIVFDDADIDSAVQGALISKYRNSGQSCVCANRMFIQTGIYDSFAEKLVAEVKKLKLGIGSQEGVTIGPLIDPKAANSVCELIDDAREQGATVLTGGGLSDLGGTFVEPTVLTGITSAMRVFREEIFGPVASLLYFETESQVISMANDTEFGLASYLYSRDIGRVWRVSEALEFGMVGINDAGISNEMAVFGGIKESGSAQEGSKYGLDDYLDIKYLCMGGLDQTMRKASP